MVASCGDGAECCGGRIFCHVECDMTAATATAAAAAAL